MGYLPKVASTTTFLSAALIGAGLAYQQFGQAKDHVTYQAPGRLTDIGGHRLHLREKGDGGPTVVVDCGLGSYSADWQLVQPAVANFARIVTYDRAGLGWSDPSPEPRTSLQIVRELKLLLDTAKVPGPYILVGHSLGGMNLQLYAHTYPSDVAGLILIDSSHHEMYDRLPPQFQALLAATTTLRAPSAVTSRLGVFQAAVDFVEPPELAQSLIDRFAIGHRPHLLVPRTWPKYADTVLRELANFQTSASQLATINRDGAAWFGNKPVTVISANVDHSVARWRRIVPFNVEAYNRIWAEMQRSLTQISTRSEFIVAAESGHSVMVEHPETVIQAIRNMVNTLR